MLDELLALDIIGDSDLRVRREATVYANLILERLTSSSSSSSPVSGRDKMVASSPVLKLLGSPIAKMVRTPSEKKPSVMPQRLQFTPGRCAVVHPYTMEGYSPAAFCYHDRDDCDYEIISSGDHEEQVKKVNDRSPDTVQAVF